MNGRFALILALTIAILADITRGQTAPSAQPAQAVVIGLSGEINDYTRDELMRRVDAARQLGAKVVILRINTYGGMVTSALDISNFLKRQHDLHIVAFVNEKAISAGSIIAVACDELVMEPQATLGDCAPILVGPAGGLTPMPTAERAKMESPILEDFYDSAVRNGYDPMMVQSMVAVGRVVHYVEGPDAQRKFVDEDEYKKLTATGEWAPVKGVRDPLDAADTLLTVKSDTAEKIGLSKGTFASVQALAQARNWTIVQTMESSVGDHFIALLGSGVTRGLLVTIFLMALYAAFHAPGHGMAEAVCAVTLAVLLGVPLLTGYAQWYEVVAILLGVVLLALEVFVVPGFGITGISGIILVLGGLVMTFVPREPSGIPGLLPQTISAIKSGILFTTGGLASSLLLWVWLQRYLPKLPYFNRLILAAPNGSTASSDQPRADASVFPEVGVIGRAVTDLRPGGTAAFFDLGINDTRTVDVISDHGYVKAQTPVIVRESSRARVVVREAAAAATTI